MTRYTEDELKKKVQDGYILESPDEMTPGYKKALTIQLMVQGDTELMSAPAYWGAAQDAPSTNTMVSAVAIIQDELAHANIAYRLLEDMGQDPTSSSIRTGSTSRWRTGRSWSRPTASSTGRGSRSWVTSTATPATGR